MLSTTALRSVWGPVCAGFARARVVLNGDAPITVDRRTVDAWEALSYVLAMHEYECDPSQTGAYNCRPITGGTGYSLHAFGIACDINWRDNPYQRPTQYQAHGLVTDLTAEAADILDIVTNDGVQVFRWGADYAVNKDPMHFEVVCSPAELAAGIRGVEPSQFPPQRVVDTRPDPSRPPEDEDLMRFARCKNEDGRDELFRLTTEGRLEHSWQSTLGGDYGDFVPLGGNAVWQSFIQPTLSDDPSPGRIEVFGTNGFGGVFVIHQTVENGGWLDEPVNLG